MKIPSVVGKGPLPVPLILDRATKKNEMRFDLQNPSLNLSRLYYHLEFLVCPNSKYQKNGNWNQWSIFRFHLRYIWRKISRTRDCILLIYDINLWSWYNISVGSEHVLVMKNGSHFPYTYTGKLTFFLTKHTWTRESVFLIYDVNL